MKDEERILEFKATPGFGKWKKYFPKEAVAHPAKINQNLLEYLILNYTKEGDVVLDPMSGTGSTNIIAGINGRNAICVELEEKFWEMQVGIDCDGWSCHVLGCHKRGGLEAKIKKLERELHGVKREQVWKNCVWIEDEMGSSAYIDEEKTLPHWLELYHNFLALDEAKAKLEKLPKKPHHFTGCKELFEQAACLNKGQVLFLKGDARNLSELLKEHKEGISSVLFSPPYAESIKRRGREEPKERVAQRLRDAGKSEEYIQRYFTDNPSDNKTKGYGVDDRYSDDTKNIGNLPFNADCIVTSPPYSEGIGHSQGKRAGHDMVGKEGFVGYYGNGEKENIGNLPHGEIDTILTSPPYAASKAFCDLQFMDTTSKEFSERIRRGEIKGHFMSAEARRQVFEKLEKGRIENDENIGNLPFGFDAIITSPPYSEGTGHGRGKSERLQKEKKLYLHGAESYSTNSSNIGEIKVHGEIDTILTSPPYASSKSGGEADENKMAERWDRIAKEKEWNTWGKTWTTEGRKRALKSLGSGYSEDKENIGNLKKESYLEAMQSVYAECFKVLKEEGLLILVLKNFIRDKKVVPLTEHTIKLCTRVGFNLKERLLFKLPSQSFWRILYKKKYPEVDVSDLDYEHILIFEKSTLTKC